MMINTDLRVHSTYSGGELTPKEIIAKAMEEDVHYLSITDVNHVMTYREFKALQKKFNGKLIMGTEAVCRWNGVREVHICLYGDGFRSVKKLLKARKSTLPSMEELLDAAAADGLCPVLCDILRYPLGRKGRFQLIKDFKDILGPGYYPAGMEIITRHYNRNAPQVQVMKNMADLMHLYYSSGSNFYGKFPDDNSFMKQEYLEEIEEEDHILRPILDQEEVLPFD